MTTRLKLSFILPTAAMLLGGASPAPQAGVDIDITVTGLRNDHGVIRACMTSQEDRFPKCRGVAQAYSAAVEAHAGPVTVTLRNVQPGRYAIALLHDENGNGRADRALGMMPKEGFGFSRDAPVRMGPPRFDDAAFQMGETDKAMRIRMRYML